VTLAWQSRFGREPWLEPATDRVLVDLAGRARTVAVLVPGFSADCLETIEELGIRGARASVRPAAASWCSSRR
jgi:ferrochelatase